MPYPIRSRTPREALAACALLASLLSCVARGQTSLGDTLVLSLSDARQIALERSTALAAARYRLHAAEADTIGAHLLPNPLLSVNATSVDVLHGPPNFTGASTSYRLDQTFPIAGQRGNRVLTARASTEAARESFDYQVFQTNATIRDSYIDAAYAQINIDLARQNYDLFAKLIAAANARLHAGDIAEEDVTKLELTELTYRQTLNDARQNLLDAINSLKQAIGLDTNAPIAVKYDFQSIARDASETSISRDSLERVALARRADLSATEYTVQAAQHQIALARSNAWPTPDIGLELDRSGPDFPNLFGGGIGIAIPLFSRNQDEIYRAESNERAAEYDYETARLGVRTDLATAYEKYNNSLDLFRGLSPDILKMATDVRDHAMQNYTSGRIGLLDLLSSEQVYHDAMASYYGALYTLARNLSLLERAVGVDSEDTQIFKR
ncbi:MAG: TolC family protein [Bacteroidota bacterium]|nr:TolC family protein [Bacteroidota bacterium]MDP4231951.1 TolC family protein [Bacteroidota bacterium]MDP4241342.1 TolC family protein [Bacteroidota bacterium]MDP4287263.1 TolC family protein [Bacteroidota bacterium]